MFSCKFVNWDFDCDDINILTKEIKSEETKIKNSQIKMGYNAAYLMSVGYTIEGIVSSTGVDSTNLNKALRLYYYEALNPNSTYYLQDILDRGFVIYTLCKAFCTINYIASRTDQTPDRLRHWRDSYLLSDRRN